MNYSRLAGALLGLTGLIYSANATAASVITVAYEVSKNDDVINNTSIMTVDGEKLRVDYLGSESKRTTTTPFLLTTDNGKSWVMGNQEKEEYYCANVTMNEFFEIIGDLVTKIDSYTNPEYSNTRVEQTLEKDGPAMFGHPTVHVRIQTTATLKAHILIKKFEYKVKKTDDFWYAKTCRCTRQDYAGLTRSLIPATSISMNFPDKYAAALKGLCSSRKP